MMFRKLFLATLLTFGFGFESNPSLAQTPNLNCDAAANNASAYVKSNEADNCLDNGVNAYTSIEAFSSDANSSLTDAQLRASNFIDVTSAGSLTATRDLDLGDGIEREITIQNSTTGDQAIRVIVNAGTTCTILPGLAITLQSDGTNVLSEDGFCTTSEVTSTTGDRYLIYDVSGDTRGYVLHENMPGSGGGAASASVLGSCVELGSVTASAAADADISGFDPTLYDHYLLSVINADISADDSLAIRLSDDGGSTFEAGTGYHWGLSGANDSGTGFDGGGQNDSEAEFQATDGGAATSIGHYWVRIGALDNSSHKTWAWSGTMPNGTGEHQWTAGAGRFDGNTSNINGVQILTTGAATFDAVITLEGCANGQNALGTVQTTDATTTQIYERAIAAGVTVLIEVSGVGREDSTGDTIAQTLTNICRNEGGTTTCGTALETGANAEMTLGSPAAGWDFDIVADDTADEFDVEVVGEAANTIDWVVHIQTVTQQ